MTAGYANVTAPAIAKIPPKTQQVITNQGFSTLFSINPVVKKTPEPTIELNMSETESVKESVRFNSINEYFDYKKGRT